VRWSHTKTLQRRVALGLVRLIHELEALEKAIQASAPRHFKTAKPFRWSHSAEELKEKLGVNPRIRVLGLTGIYRHYSFRLAEPHQFLKIPCRITVDLVDDSSVDACACHVGVAKYGRDGI
jgi:hypothetical protein